MPFLRMFSKRNPGKDVESKDWDVYGNKDLRASISAVTLGATLASPASTLPFARGHEYGMRLHTNGAQAENLAADSTTSLLDEPGPLEPGLKLSMKPSNSTFHPSLFKLAGRNLSSSNTSTAAAASSTLANETDTFTSTIRRNDAYRTPATTIGGDVPPSGDKTLKKGRTKRQKNRSLFTQSNESSQQSPSPPEDSQLALTQRLAEAAKKARLNAARQALETPTSGGGVHQVMSDKPLPPGPQPEQPEFSSIVKQDSRIDSIPAEAQLSTDPERNPIILVLEEILSCSLLKQENIRLQIAQAESSVKGQLLESDILDAQLPSPNAEFDIPAQPPPYQETSTKATPPQEELLSLQLQLEQYKTRVDSLTKEKLELLRHQHDEITTVLQQVKQSCAETHRITLEQRRYRILAETLRKEKHETDHQLKLMDAAHKQEISALQSRIKTKDAENEQLNKEKANWQAQIDAMQHRLSGAERRVRCLDQVTRQRFEAKQGGYASVGRCTMFHHSPHVKGPSMDIISAVASFNDEVFQTSTFLVENLDKVDPKEPAFITNEVTTRARHVWGLKVVSMLDMQAKDATAFNFLLLQNCLEVFITHWCMHIIEGWYPPQASFSDVLVELTAQTTGMTSAEKQQICGKQVKIMSTESATPEFDAWVNEIIGDLSRILLVGGVKMGSGGSDILPSKLRPLIKIAYDLRLALAEKDICGGLELAAPSPDLPFHPDFMQDAEEHALQGSRKKNTKNFRTDGFEPEFIAGTSALGLKRTLNGQPGAYEIVVKPRVVLIHVLETTS